MELLRHIQSIIVKFLFNVLLVIALVKGLGQTHEQEPEFLQPLINLTVTQGRDVSFTCVVNNLGQYRVAWIKSDSKAILAIHTHMVALNPRLSVTHNGHDTWKLHISHVQLNDSGSYMCQVNTDPMRSQSGHLDVVVPPDILNSPEIYSADESVTNEGGNVQLMCQATGVPEPSVHWKRDDGKDIVIRSEGRDKQLTKIVEGERLSLSGVHRSDMGGYLCIASNGIPPSVSKRYDVQVNFPPSVKAVNQLVAAPVGSHVLLECIVEAFGKPLNTWYRSEDTKLYHGEKYLVSESLINSFTWQMNLTVRNLHKNDFTPYTCASENALGKSDARIRLQELHLEKPTTTPTPHVATAKPTRRPKQKEKSHDSSKGKDALGPNQIQRESELYAQSEAVTQNPPKANGDKNRSQQQASIGPSRSPMLIHHSNYGIRSNENAFKYYFVAFAILLHLLLA